MAVFSRVKTWVSNEVLTASDLNAEFNNLLNNTIPASIEDQSADVATMQATADPGGVGTESLATTLAGEIQRLRFAIKRIAGGAQWYTAPAYDLGSTIAAGDIANDAITTDKILDGNVTPAKLSASNHTLSLSCGSTSVNNVAYTDVANLTATITATGRPVLVMLVPDGSGNTTGTGNTSDCFLAFVKNTVVTAEFRLPGSGSYQPANFSFVDVAGTTGSVEYKVQVKGSVAVPVRYMKLLVKEL